MASYHSVKAEPSNEQTISTNSYDKGSTSGLKSLPVPIADSNNNDEKRKRWWLYMAMVGPCISLFCVRLAAFQAGCAWISVFLCISALLLLTNHTFFDEWLLHTCFDCSKDVRKEQKELHDNRRPERHESGMTIFSHLLIIGALFHISNGDIYASGPPLVILVVIQLLRPSHIRYFMGFLSFVPFTFFCHQRGGSAESELCLWSPIVILSFISLMTIESASIHTALDLWRLAVLMRFCVTFEIKIAASSIMLLCVACRALEGQYDINFIVARKTGRQINDKINADQKQLIGVLSHEIKNRLDIINNLITDTASGISNEDSANGIASSLSEIVNAGASDDDGGIVKSSTIIKPQGSSHKKGNNSKDISELNCSPRNSNLKNGEEQGREADLKAIVEQSAVMQQSVSVILDLLEIEKRKFILEDETFNEDQDLETRTHLENPAKFPTPSQTSREMICTNLMFLVQSAWDSSSAAVLDNSKTVPFRLQIDDELTNDGILINKNRLHWIMCHLLANACTGCGTGPNSKVTVRISAMPKGGKDNRKKVIVVSIENTGIKHSQEVLDRALKFHVQSQYCKKRRWRGNGIGLRHTAAMLQLLECPPLRLTASGNTVSARFGMPYRPCVHKNKENNGAGAATTTKSGVDTSQETQMQIQNASKNEIRSNNTTNYGLNNVLVVDDEKMIRKLMARSLQRKFGSNVSIAENGAKGVEIYQNQMMSEEPPSSKFDLILMDIQMPVLNGISAVRNIRALEQKHDWPRACILSRTANTSESDRAHYKECGMDGCLSKAGNITRQIIQAMQQINKKEIKQEDDSNDDTCFVFVGDGA